MFRKVREEAGEKTEGPQRLLSCEPNRTRTCRLSLIFKQMNTAQIMAPLN